MTEGCPSPRPKEGARKAMDQPLEGEKKREMGS